MRFRDVRCLSMCSSRRRPQLCRRMLDSFYATKTDDRTQIVVYVANDDPCLEEYRDVLVDCEYIIGKHRYNPHIMNWVSTVVHPGLPYYHEVNDDHVFRSKVWDSDLIATIEEKGGWGVACGNDLVREDWMATQLPSAAVFSGNLVRALGYMIYPGFRHICCDDHTKTLGNHFGFLYYVPTVIIEHCHFVANKAVQDANYQWAYSKEEWDYGWSVHAQWKAEVLPEEIRRIEAAMKAGQQ